MKQDIKNKEFRENQEYVSPSVKVIEITAHGVLCASGENSTGFGDYNNGGSF